MNDLFQLQASISIEIQKGLDNLTKLGIKANEVAEQIQDGLGGNNQVQLDSKKAQNSLVSLTSAISKQETELGLLKEQYQNVYLEQGKNSKEAKALASQIDKLSSELKENKDKLNDSKKASDGLDKSFDDLDNSAKGVANGGFTVLKGAMANLISNGFQKLLSGATSLISGAAEYQSQMEQYAISFEVMTGSAEKAAEVTAKLGEVAKKTPFEMTDLADTTQLLMNYGLTADDAISKMQMLGDISQGSADKMNRISMAYGQMSSAGKVSLEDVKQMIEAGFNPLQEISQTTGESMSSLYDRISKGKISVDEITASMVRSTSEGGKYFGSMDKQSQSLSGRMATLKDTINSSLGQVLVPILEKLATEVLPKVTSAIEKIDWETLSVKAGEVFEKVIEFGSWLITNIETIGTVVGVIAGIVAVLKTFNLVMGITNAVMAASPVTWIVLGIVAAVAALIAIIVLLVKNWDKVKETAQNVWNAIKNAWNQASSWFTNNVVNPVVNTFTNLWNKITNIFNKVKTTATTIWNSIKSAIMKPINEAKTAVEKVINAIKKLFDFKWSLPTLKKPSFSITPKGWKVGDLLKGEIPKLSVKWNKEGAIFNKPAIFDTQYGLQGVGEAGAEAIAPIDKLQGYVTAAVKNETSGLHEQLSQLTDLLKSYLPQIMNNSQKQIVLNSGVLVGELAPTIDEKLGNMYIGKGRGR